MSTGTLLSAEPAPASPAPRRPVRPGWTLPVAAVGALTLGVGWWQYQSVATKRMACDLLDAMAALSGSTPATACQAVRSQQTLGLILIAAGLAELLIGSLAASRRGLKAARQGDPWPLRRAFTRVARALDSRLPGYRPNRPRISQAWIAATLFVALVWGVSATVGAWQAHSKSVRHHRYVAAERALNTMALPSAVSRKSLDPLCHTTADSLCASSSQSPAELTGSLSALLHGKLDSGLCDALGMPSDPLPCPATIYGTIAGYPAVAVISEHLVTVTSGKPPAGATPVSARMKTLYALGSDITIGVASPVS